MRWTDHSSGTLGDRSDRRSVMSAMVPFVQVSRVSSGPGCHLYCIPVQIGAVLTEGGLVWG